MKRPMLLGACISSITVIVGACFPMALIFIAVLLISLLVWLKINNKKSQYTVVAVSVLIVIFSVTHSLSQIQKLSLLDGKSSNCVFTVCEITYNSPTFSCADIKIKESNILKKGTRLTLSYYDAKLKIGDTVSATLKLEPLDEKYKANYYSKRIFLEAEATEYEILENESDFLLKTVGNIRKYIKETVFKYLDFHEAATLCALLFGDRSFFTTEFYNNVVVSGVSHVMVVSGMHLAIFVTLFTAAINKLFYNRYITALAILFSALLLCTVCGFTMSILRAGVMYIILALGLIIKRKNVSENALGAAVSIILAVSPFAIFNLGFQLSVMSTFGILAIALPIDRYVTANKLIKGSVLKGLFSSVIISLSATLLTLPITINAFGFVSTVGVITTLIITYPMTFSIWISVVGLIINLIFPSLAELIFVPCKYLLRLTNTVINEMGVLPFAVVNTPKIWVIVTTGLIILIFYVLLACKSRLDVIKLKEMQAKIISEGGGKLKWQ